MLQAAPFEFLQMACALLEGCDLPLEELAVYREAASRASVLLKIVEVKSCAQETSILMSNDNTVANS